MFDNKTFESTIRTRDVVPQAEVCVCLCVCLCVCVCVCVCLRACVPARHTLKLTSKVHFELRRVQTIKYTQNM